MNDHRALMVASAWTDAIGDQCWYYRRNKAHDDRQWEVVHDIGGPTFSDETQFVVGRYSTRDEAIMEADRLEKVARGSAVLRALEDADERDYREREMEQLAHDGQL